MTFLERRRKQFDNARNDEFVINYCPCDFGYESDAFEECLFDKTGNELSCRECWNREIPEENIEEKGETKMATTRKTKDELMQELVEKNAEIGCLKRQIASLERYKQYDEAANELKAMHDSFINSGFSRDEATRFMLKLIDKCK